MLDFMTVHVTIGEAEGRLSELVEAAIRGEEIFLDDAGQPQVRLVPVEQRTREQRTPEEIRARREAAFGMWKGGFPRDYEVGPSMTEEEVEDRWRRKFGPPA